MKNLIEEIEKLKDNEVYDNRLDKGFQNTLNNTIDKCIELLNQYNIITAPKSIKLSEIVDRLNKEVILGTDYKAVVKCFGKDILIANRNISKTFDEIIAEINITKKIVWINNAYMFESCKWLYTLWIAGTTVIDDLKEEC